MTPAAPDLRGVGTVSPAEFRTALRRHAAGVVVVTWLGPAGPVGFTATSFTAASLEPALVSFYLGRDSASWESLRAVDHFAVNIMAAGQRAVADRFSRKGVDRFSGVVWKPGPLRVPFLAGVQASLACTRVSVLSIGDHVLVVGAACHLRTGDSEPLLYHDTRYGSFTAR